MPKFSTVIFDLDGLVSDTEPIHRRAFNMVLHACGANYEYDAEEYGRTITGHVIFENAERIRERFGLPQSAQEIANAHRALMKKLHPDQGGSTEKFLQLLEARKSLQSLL